MMNVSELKLSLFFSGGQALERLGPESEPAVPRASPAERGVWTTKVAPRVI